MPLIRRCYISYTLRRLQKETPTTTPTVSASRIYSIAEDVESFFMLHGILRELTLYFK